MAVYGVAEYWDQRYLATANGPPCEWYRSYHDLRHLLNSSSLITRMGPPTKQPQALLDGSGSSSAATTTTTTTKTTTTGSISSATAAATADGNSHNMNASQAMEKTLPPALQFPPKDQCRILILGCGNSTLGEEMLRDGWTGTIINTDFSKVVISQMQSKYGDAFYKSLNGSCGKQRMQYLCADMTRTFPFDPESFDLVICKASFDAVLCSVGSKVSAAHVITECARVLARGHGIFLLVTSGNADNRLEHLEYRNQLDHYWQNVSVHDVPLSSAQSSRLSLSSASSDAGKSASSNYATSKTVYAYVCRKHYAGATSQKGDENKENVSISK